MPPFIPPPANVAPYRALPHTDFTSRFKLKLSLGVYLRWQFIGIALLPLMIVCFALAHPSQILHDAHFRNNAVFFCLYVAALPGGFGIVCAVWKYVTLTIDDHRARPPKSN